MQEELKDELDRMGLFPTDRGRYYLIHCPQHDDRTKSAQCFKDGWIHCHAGCKRIHINSLCSRNIVARDYDQSQDTHRDTGRDFTEFWLQFEAVDYEIKGVPPRELNRRGWRKFPGGWGIAPGTIIPYFNVDRSRVIYFQVRHDEGARRFTFPRGATPRTYGLEQLRYCERYLVFTEGSRDSVILGMAGVPAVALPSASSKRALGGLERYARAHGLIPVYAGDRDVAGDNLLSAIQGPFIDARSSVGKDVGDLYEQHGLEGVIEQYGTYKAKGLESP